MNFDFSDDLKMLRDQARKFLRDRASLMSARRILEGSEPFDKALWREMAEMGWIGAAIPEEFGGAGLGHLALCVLAEELGQALAAVPFSSSVYLASEALLLAGTNAQKARYLPRLASGELIGTLAVAEGPSVADLKKLRATASDGKLTGTKLPVPDGDVADLAVVAARGGDRGLSLFLVDLQSAGVTRETVGTIDHSRSHARIVFDRAAAEPL